VSDPTTPTDRDEDERIDADHPRPGRRTPYRTGQGQGVDTAGETAPQAGLTGDDVAAGDETESASDPKSGDDQSGADDVEPYRDSPGAGLLRGDEVVPEPNEPG
jgi:hypothetical protein